MYIYRILQHLLKGNIKTIQYLISTVRIKGSLLNTHLFSTYLEKSLSICNYMNPTVLKECVLLDTSYST